MNENSYLDPEAIKKSCTGASKKLKSNNDEMAGIDCYDLREAIHNENLYHHGLFYRTDHHWLGTTGDVYKRQVMEQIIGLIMLFFMPSMLLSLIHIFHHLRRCTGSGDG